MYVKCKIGNAGLTPQKTTEQFNMKEARQRRYAKLYKERSTKRKRISLKKERATKQMSIELRLKPPFLGRLRPERITNNTITSQ